MQARHRTGCMVLAVLWIARCAAWTRCPPPRRRTTALRSTEQEDVQKIQRLAERMRREAEELEAQLPRTRRPPEGQTQGERTGLESAEQNKDTVVGTTNRDTDKNEETALEDGDIDRLTKAMAGTVDGNSTDARRNQNAVDRITDQLKKIVAEDTVYEDACAELAESCGDLVYPADSLSVEEAEIAMKVHRQNVARFVDVVLRDKDVLRRIFQYTEQPRHYEFASLIGGVPMTETGDGLLQALQDTVRNRYPEFNDAFSFYLIRDPITLSEMNEVDVADSILSEITRQESENPSRSVDIFSRLQVAFEQFDLLQKPALLLVPKDTTIFPARPTSSNSVRALVTMSSVVAMSVFSASCYGPANQDLLTMILAGLATPIFWALLLITFLHEVGHYGATAIVNARARLSWDETARGGPYDDTDDIQLAVPSAILPCPSTGTLPAQTLFSRPPHNMSDLFDIAIAGPVLGLLASGAFLLAGLQLTLAVPPSAIGQLPHVPLPFLQLSGITSASIQSFIGTDLLLSLDPMAGTVPCHPYLIAGHIGLLVNALSLLPVGSVSDGKRMASAVFGKTSAVMTLLNPAMFGLLLVIGALEWDTCNAFLLYALVSEWPFDNEKTCRNSVDITDTLRRVVFFVTTLFAVVAVSPL